MNTNTFLACLLCVLAVLTGMVQYGDAHGMLIIPQPRTYSLSTVSISHTIVVPTRLQNNNQRTAPCGSVSKGQITQSYKGNQNISVTWNVEANHGGTMSVYVIDYSDSSTVTLASGVAAAPGNTTIKVTIPNYYCSNCTLQWVWTSTEPTPYYGCVDISVAAPVKNTSTTPTNGATSTKTTTSTVRNNGNQVIVHTVWGVFLAIVFACFLK